VDPLIVELLSLFTAVCYGASSVIARKGMKDSNPMTGVIVGSLVQVILLAILVIADPPAAFNWTAIGLFVASGIFASTLGRLLNFMSIDRIGVALSASIIGSSPLFSTLLAALFLGEQVDLATLLGTILIVAGIAVARSGGQALKNIRSNALVLPIASAIFYGASSVVRKAALSILPESAFGAVVGAMASLSAFAIYLLLSRRTDELQVNWAGGKFWVVNGVVVTLAWLAMFAHHWEGLRGDSPRGYQPPLLSDPKCDTAQGFRGAEFENSCRKPLHRGRGDGHNPVLGLAGLPELFQVP
jgi:drug/metabolite transporter (DMT)-like permease